MINLMRTRLRNLARATGREISLIAEDSKLFLRTSNGKSVLRQGRIRELDMLVRANENVGRNIYFYGRYEQQDSDFLIGSVKESDVCIDGGANVGFYTLALAKTAIHGTVHAFEPVPLNRDLLSVNVLTNRLENIVINQSVLGDRNGVTELYVADDEAFSSLINTGRKPIKGTIAAPMITLDEYCDRRGLEHVDIVKVDVEGAEGRVISGASDVLSDQRRQPRLMMLELYEPMLRKFDCSIDHVLRVLDEYGYDPFIVQKQTLLPYEEKHQDSFENVFFVARKQR